MKKIKIAVSACLLGQNVRYDGNNKYIDLYKHFNSDEFEFIALCPEVEMGMNIPRPPMHIINNKGIRLVQIAQPENDLTQQFHKWFMSNNKRIKHYAGYILKSKSPSCGNQTTSHHNLNNNPTLSDGMFVYLLKQYFQNPNIIDEIQLNNALHLSGFLDKLTKMS